MPRSKIGNETRKEDCLKPAAIPAATTIASVSDDGGHDSNTSETVSTRPARSDSTSVNFFRTRRKEFCRFRI